MRTFGIAATAGALASAFACAVASPAFAQAYGSDVALPPLKAPRQAFELGLSTGYTQGLGLIHAGRTIGELAGGGMGAGLELGYRANPNVSIGATGQYSAYNANDTLARGTRVWGANAGVAATFHTAPYQSVDPWISVGTGYRMLFQAPSGAARTTMTHGFELAKMEIGVDVRPSDSVAIAPTIGADLNMFMWENPGTGNVALEDRRINAFVFAGVKGRFDLGGARESAPVRVGSR